MPDPNTTMGDDSTERVARAICRARIYGPYVELSAREQAFIDVSWPNHAPEARAAIASMRAEILEGPELIEAILGYGGRCRDCADSDGMCLGSRLPCHPDDARKAIAHVLSAVAYYREHPEFVRSLSPPVHSVPE